jgi:hypothetical protein
MRKPKENKNCPYCLSPVEPDEERVRCPKCGVIHHADCWKANGSCSVYGCDGWAVWSSAISDKVAPQTRESVEIIPVEAGAEAAKEVCRCIQCGAEVRKGQMKCYKCIARWDNHFFDNCSGPSVLFIGSVVGIAVIIIRALS